MQQMAFLTPVNKPIPSGRVLRDVAHFSKKFLMVNNVKTRPAYQNISDW